MNTETIKYIRKNLDGNVGKVIGTISKYLIVEFKTNEIKAVPNNLINESFESIDEKTYKKTKTEAIMAKQKDVAQENSKTAGKPTAVKEGSIADLSNFKLDLRKKLNGLDAKVLPVVAKKFGVDMGKYKHLPNEGLRRMNTVNSVIGACVKMLKKENKSKTQVLALLKG